MEIKIVDKDLTIDSIEEFLPIINEFFSTDFHGYIDYKNGLTIVLFRDN